MVVSNRDFVLDVMDAMSDVGGPMAAPALRVFVNNANVTPTSVPADFEVGVNAGLADKAALVVGGAYVNGAGEYVLPIPDADFVAASPLAGPETIYGWVVLNTAKDQVLYGKTLDEPVELALAGDGISVNPDYIWPETFS